ncbi:hypothetical protein ACOZG6_002136 [Proteus mirabilis]|nr:hypothetical protein [Proteus mirabilis]EKU2370930.1 hypothetical protein [Proteus mirabilis]EKU7918588.1 hypothetical protein [Proteus mirabilis]EKU7922663.1 hypothetical protein [Proteus mirabilis]EKU8691629.1 hypothetical protein [Proteus mirabilis]EKU8703995.1 hypothetical protein [Proteus mirabilis]
MPAQDNMDVSLIVDNRLLSYTFDARGYLTQRVREDWTTLICQQTD